MILLILLIPLALLIWYIVVKVKALGIKPERCLLFTGSMGSGKTLVAVCVAGMLRGKQNVQQLFKKIRHPFRYKFMPVYIYSNIPLRSKWYRPLEAEHVLRRKVLPELSIVLIDEIGGTLADQYSYQSQVLTQYLSLFVRFSRHWFNGYVVLTDQTSDSVPKPVRDRVACEYHLSNCRTFLFMWKKIDVVPVRHITADMEQSEQRTQKEDKQFRSEYLLLKIPFGKYETRCYRYTYRKGFVFKPVDDLKTDGELYTRLYLDVEPEQSLSKLMKDDRKKCIRTIYGESIQNEE